MAASRAQTMAMGDVLSGEDYDQLVDVLVAFKEIGDASFGLEQLPQVEANDRSPRLIKVDR
jgi:hypothetical protein